MAATISERNTMKEWKLTLEETRDGCAPYETHPRYRVMLNGEPAGMLSFNMRGYSGHLPTPLGTMLDIGDSPISAVRRAVAAMNKEAASARRKWVAKMDEIQKEADDLIDEINRRIAKAA